MAQSAGIIIEQDVQGVPIFARIDLRKYGNKLKDFFASEDVVVKKSPYNPEFVKMIKDAAQSPTVASFSTKEELNAWFDSL